MTEERLTEKEEYLKLFLDEGLSPNEIERMLCLVEKHPELHTRRIRMMEEKEQSSDR